MKKLSLLFFSLMLVCTTICAQQTISLPVAKFKTGDNASWKDRDFNDASWETLKTGINWDSQGYSNYDGYAWYRVRFTLPKELLENSYYKEQLSFNLWKIDDDDETYLNGKLIGETKGWNKSRLYAIDADDPAVLWGQENVLAIRVYDGSGEGGNNGGVPFVYVNDLIDGLLVNITPDEKDKKACILTLKNTYKEAQTGSLQIAITGSDADKTTTEKVQVKQGATFAKKVAYSAVIGQRVRIDVTYTDNKTGKTKQALYIPTYILTPAASAEPIINGAKVFGIRPGSPFLFKIAVSGEKPIQYEVKDLPQGLSLDKNTGVITGKLDKEGDYKMTFVAGNAKGKCEREFTVKVGEALALTPPMGWNSWNCWGPSVTDAKVRSSAQALIDKGLIDYGWTYINVDDFWESEARNQDGVIGSNKNFPSMKALGDWLHANGLKYGVYSSPGTRTCGGCLGSYTYEDKDAESYAEWGVDYLKYDWCSYGAVYEQEGDKSLYAYMKPYITMQKQLKAQNRDIVYSLCQYGMRDVWQWGPAVEGNCWRTTGDITDTWESLSNIGFSQAPLYPYARPGHWNDPDMLVVGMVGWGDNLHPTGLTCDEQYTHISLWCLLASPLLIGCDISQMDDFTLNLLTNNEVLDVNQDPLGKQAQRVIKDGDIQIWVKEMLDGSKAVGIFNLGTEDTIYNADLSKFGFSSPKVRDLWRQKDLSFSGNSLSLSVPSHGVALLKVK